MFWRVKVLGSESELVKAVGAPSALMTMLKGVLAAGPSLLWERWSGGISNGNFNHKGWWDGDSRKEG